ncbi:MAG: pirin family protein, partial [Cyanobacteria bacterium P01_D01_bin.156]
EERQGNLRLVGSRDGRDGSITIHQDLNLYAAQLNSGEQISYTVPENRAVWIQSVRGDLRIGHHDLGAGDGAAITASEKLIITGQTEDAEFLLFDMPEKG